jgi:hypothetical protein
MVTRYALVDDVPVEELVEFRSSDRGRFVGRLCHRQKLAMVDTNEGLVIPSSVHAERVWEACHSVAHLVGECSFHWSTCLSREPWWSDSQTEYYYRHFWGKGGQVVDIALSSKSAYVNFVSMYGTEVVFVGSSASLAHVGVETRTLPATVRFVEGSDSRELIDPNYLNAPVRDGVVLLGDDGSGMDVRAEVEFEHLRQLKEESACSGSALKEYGSFVNHIKNRIL